MILEAVVGKDYNIGIVINTVFTQLFQIGAEYLVQGFRTFVLRNGLTVMILQILCGGPDGVKTEKIYVLEALAVGERNFRINSVVKSQIIIIICPSLRRKSFC